MLLCLPLLLLIVALTSMASGEPKGKGKGKSPPAPPSFDECPDISGGWSTRSPVNSYLSVLNNGTVDGFSIPYEHALDLSNFAGTTCAFAGRAFGASPNGEASSDPVNGAFTVSSSDAALCFTVTWLFDPDIPVAIEGRGCVTDDPDVINFAFTTTVKLYDSSITFTSRMQLYRMTNVELEAINRGEGRFLRGERFLRGDRFLQNVAKGAVKK